MVTEAEALVVAVQATPRQDSFPLFPGEVDRIRRPPPVGPRPIDYEDRLAEAEGYPDDWAALRSGEVLAHDLTLMRLGYDPDEPSSRGALLVELHRARRRAGGP